ncbi:hypothetical protein PIB30_048182 [Stylosanthes scabra]|uniref:Uncharacterized protein n=1 Tax=Stylosanthes scabra TaxID=79078 RepID=A0ABU6ZFP2_9FABA|nr:hypothetical protein [Stylosanthes scabra]
MNTILSLLHCGQGARSVPRAKPSRGYEGRIYSSWWQRAAKRLRDLFHEIRNKGAPHPWIRDDLWDQLVEFWRQEDFKKLKEVNKQNRASSTGGSLHTGGSTTYEATRERMDVDTASAPDLRERVVMLNREISQQAEANAQRVAALEYTVPTQSQEVSDLRKAYADMYSLLTQMRSGGSSSAPLPDSLHRHHRRLMPRILIMWSNNQIKSREFELLGRNGTILTQLDSSVFLDEFNVQ